MQKTLVRILLNTALGAVLIWGWLQIVDIKQVLVILKTADLRLCIIFILCFAFSTSCRAFRLKLLLSRHKIPYKELALLNFLAQFLSFTIPVRAGEIAKSAYLSTRYKLSIGEALISILIDRFFDFWMVLVTVSVSTYFINRATTQQINKVVLLALLGFTVAAIIIIISQSFAKRLVHFGEQLLVFRPLQKAFQKFSYSIIEGFSLLQMPIKRWAAVLSVTFLATMSDALIWSVSLRAVGLNLNWTETIASSGLTALSFLIPAAPGFVGSAEAAGLVVLGYVLGVDSTLASSATVFNHIVTLLVLPVFGLTALYLLKFDLSLVWKRLRSGKA